MLVVWHSHPQAVLLVMIALVVAPAAQAPYADTPMPVAVRTPPTMVAASAAYYSMKVSGGCMIEMTLRLVAINFVDV